MSKCECFTKMNDALAAKNGRLATAFQVTGELGLTMHLCVATEKVDKTKRKPVPPVIANYCPFCGASLKG